MNILIIGAGGREHALAWKLKQSRLLTNLYAAPGSDAIGQLATLLPLDITDKITVVKACLDYNIQLVVIGPEAPLTDALGDILRQAGIYVFGPNQNAARLEGSKQFAKDFCKEFNIPTAIYENVMTKEDAHFVCDIMDAPIVIKADGLAAGKGVVVAETLDEAHEAIDRLSQIGDGSLVLEQKLVGREVSYFIISDGQRIFPLGAAEDHKRAFNGDEGPNTGGMGAISPSPLIDQALESRILNEIARPTIDGLKAKGMNYCGVLFLGLMITQKGPELIEYNVRFGDPECQLLMGLMEGDLLPVLLTCAKGGLDEHYMKNINMSGTGLCLVLAAKGYPEGVIKANAPITNLQKILTEIDESGDDVMIFHAGTKLDKTKEGQSCWQANGGRVLNIVAFAPDLKLAKEKAYYWAEKLDWQDGFYRSDIGDKVIFN